MKEKRIVYGINPVKEQIRLVQKGTLYFIAGQMNNKLKELEKKAENKGISPVFLDKASFYEKYGQFHHQGIVLEIETEYSFLISEEEFYSKIDAQQETKEDTILILDGVKDVGNFGAILRSALLFEVQYVLLPKNHSAPVNEIVIKRSSGAVFQLNIVYVTNLNRVIHFLKEKGYWVYGTDMKGASLEQHRFPEKSVIVLGDEETGIRRLVKENCDEILSIPTNQKLDSLNVSVSCAILLYERFKQLKI